jgi:Putative S-adenosyl-L-methionine-dependent methyltransferase
VPPCVLGSRAVRVDLVEVSDALRKLQWSALRCGEGVAASEMGISGITGCEVWALMALAALSQLCALWFLVNARTQIYLSGYEASVPTTAPSNEGLPELASICLNMKPQFRQWHHPTTASRNLHLSLRVDGCGCCVVGEVRWHRCLDTVTDLPAAPIHTIFIAHEFLDAMPVHRFRRTPDRGCAGCECLSIYLLGGTLSVYVFVLGCHAPRHSVCLSICCGGQRPCPPGWQSVLDHM